MNINEKEIRKYAQLMQELGLTGLEIKDMDQMSLRLERAPAAAFPAQTAAGDFSQAVKVSETADSGDTISVKSPIVGVFYAAPAENADPFVSEGDRVKKGQTLCIVEAMKLMNEIVAEEDGVISRICVTNGQVVEFGTELFRIRR